MEPEIKCDIFIHSTHCTTSEFSHLRRNNSKHGTLVTTHQKGLQSHEILGRTTVSTRGLGQPCKGFEVELFSHAGVSGIPMVEQGRRFVPEKYLRKPSATDGTYGSKYWCNQGLAAWFRAKSCQPCWTVGFFLGGFLNSLRQLAVGFFFWSQFCDNFQVWFPSWC